MFRETSTLITFKAMQPGLCNGFVASYFLEWGRGPSITPLTVKRLIAIVVYSFKAVIQLSIIKRNQKRRLVGTKRLQ